MRILNFAKRNLKELIRDPMSIIFGLLLPLFFLVIFQQFNIPSEVYKIENFTPSIIIFSYSFITLFTSQLVAKDRSSSLLIRLFSSPMKPLDYILGYTISILPLAIIQSVLFFLVGSLFGLELTINVLWVVLILIPVAILFVELGIFIGCITNDKQAPGFGSLIVQLVAFTSGMWFPISISGNIYKIICKILPFSHALDITRILLISSSEKISSSILLILVYIIGLFIIINYIFNKKMTSDEK